MIPKDLLQNEGSIEGIVKTRLENLDASVMFPYYHLVISSKAYRLHCLVTFTL